MFNFEFCTYITSNSIFANFFHLSFTLQKAGTSIKVDYYENMKNVVILQIELHAFIPN